MKWEGQKMFGIFNPEWTSPMIYTTSVKLVCYVSLVCYFEETQSLLTYFE